MGDLLARFTVNGAPVGKARPRLTKTGHVYTPKATGDYERAVRLAALASTSLRGHALPVALVVTVHHAPVAKRSGWAMAAQGYRPDLDNVLKAIADGIQARAAKGKRKPSEGIIADDKQIVALTALSLYAAPGTVPRVEVAVYAAPPPPKDEPWIDSMPSPP